MLPTCAMAADPPYLGFARIVISLVVGLNQHCRDSFGGSHAHEKHATNGLQSIVAKSECRPIDLIYLRLVIRDLHKCIPHIGSIEEMRGYPNYMQTLPYCKLTQWMICANLLLQPHPRANSMLQIEHVGAWTAHLPLCHFAACTGRPFASSKLVIQSILNWHLG